MQVSAAVHTPDGSKCSNSIHCNFATFQVPSRKQRSLQHQRARCWRAHWVDCWGKMYGNLTKVNREIWQSIIWNKVLQGDYCKVYGILLGKQNILIPPSPSPLLPPSPLHPLRMQVSVCRQHHWLISVMDAVSWPVEGVCCLLLCWLVSLYYTYCTVQLWLFPDVVDNHVCTAYLNLYKLKIHLLTTAWWQRA